jgi:hypothetical protein
MVRCSKFQKATSVETPSKELQRLKSRQSLSACDNLEHQVQPALYILHVAIFLSKIYKTWRNVSVPDKDLYMFVFHEE